MIHALIEWSMKNRVIIIAIYLGLAVAGYWALLRTPIDAIPDLSDTQVIVFTDWGEDHHRRSKIKSPTRWLQACKAFPVYASCGQVPRSASR